MNFRSLSWGVLPLALAFSGASASAAPTQTPLQLKITAVAPNTFHILAYQSTSPAPPASPFIVQTALFAGAKIQNHATASSVTVPSGTFTLDSAGRWAFAGKGVQLSGLVTASLDGSAFSVKLPF